MNIANKIDQLHLRARKNRWLSYFAIFSRLSLAAGFIPSGLQKVFGERFTNLPANHPMGHYLDALYQAGYYYTFIGVMQVTAAILLLIPRTTTLGAIIYFPIILNIFILTLAVRFDGSLLSSPLMVLANLYLLCWDYHKFKFVFPFNHFTANKIVPGNKDLNNRFPTMFFVGVAATVFAVTLIILNVYDFRPHNTLTDCKNQCEESQNPEACNHFCDCIHIDGNPLAPCLTEYERTLSH